MSTGLSAPAPASALFHRLSRRDAPEIAFTINGEAVTAREGDLLVTAILTHRATLRKFEFGADMRAGYCLMGACQDCWVTLSDGSRVRACTTLVSPGMAVVIDEIKP